jgi:hypothetical protein
VVVDAAVAERELQPFAARVLVDGGAEAAVAEERSLEEVRRQPAPDHVLVTKEGTPCRGGAHPIVERVPWTRRCG